MADTPDFPKLRATLAYILANPEQWRKDRWAVKTETGFVGCLAAHAVVQAGGTLVWSEFGPVAGCELPNGRNISILAAAKEILVLNDYQARRLFSPHNDLEYLAAIIDELEAETLTANLKPTTP